MSQAVRRIRRAIGPQGGRRRWRLAVWGERLGAWVRGLDPVVEPAKAAGEAPAPRGRSVREGRLVRLRAHVPANRPAFQRWYRDEEIVRLLRHDQTPLNEVQSRAYFDTIILPLSTRDLSYAIHEAETDALIGTAALTDTWAGADSALFRIVIGEKDRWGRGYGTEATELVAWEAFTRHDLRRIRLEVFRHNDRAIRAYRRVGFREVGEHVEWVGPQRSELNVLEMVLERDAFLAGRVPPEVDGDERGGVSVP